MDETLHFAFDVKLLLQYLLEHSSADCIEHPVARFRLHERSKTVSEDNKFLPERVRIFAEFARRYQDQLPSSAWQELDLRAWSEFLQLKMREGGVQSVIEIIFGALQRPRRFNRETLGALRRLFSNSVEPG